MTSGVPSVIVGATPTGHRIRQATADDLPTCAAIWRESLNDYLGRLAQPDIPDDLGPILRLYEHLRSTDPTSFLVAEPTDGPLDGFIVVVRRGHMAFLSMLFVRPAAQGRGLGRVLLDQALPANVFAATATAAAARQGVGDAGGDGDESAVWWRATATDSVQPLSNGLYGSLGLVPRIPLVRLVGLPDRPADFGVLPGGVEPIAFDEIPSGSDGLAAAALTSELAALDRESIGFERTEDHAFQVREGRRGVLFRDRDGAAVGYGYAAESGRVGPIAVRDGALLAPILGHLIRTVRPRGAFGLWLPGSAGTAIVPLLRAGFRFDGFPVLLCWDRPFGDLSRYLPMSPGLL